MPNRQVDILHALSLLSLAYAKSKNGRVQEVQAMAVDGHVIIAVNELGDMLDIEARFDKSQASTRAYVGHTLGMMLELSRSTFMTMEGGNLAGHLPLVEEVVEEIQRRTTSVQSNWRMGIVPHMADPLPDTQALNPFEPAVVVHGDPRTSPEWFNRKKPGQIHFLKGTGYHAEQSLLTALTYRLYAKQIPDDDVVIHGVKPPCTRCKPVMVAYAAAYKTAYGQTLVYNTADGMGTEVPQIDLSEMAGLKSPDAKFTTLLKTFASKLKV
jgi:hypothetical protein